MRLLRFKWCIPFTHTVNTFVKPQRKNNVQLTNQCLSINGKNKKNQINVVQYNIIFHSTPCISHQVFIIATVSKLILA